MDNLRVHKASDVLLFSLAHSRWEFVFHPKYAAYLNLTRAVVEDAEIFSHQGALLRGLGADRGGHNAGRRLHRHPSFWRRRRRHRAGPKARRRGHMLTIPEVGGRKRSELSERSSCYRYPR